MRALIVAVMSLSACGFTPNGLGPGDDGGGRDGDDGDGVQPTHDAAPALDAPGPTLDAPGPTLDARPVDAGGAIDAGGDPYCTGTGLVACFRMNQASGPPIDGATPPLGSAVGNGANYQAGCHGTALDLGAGVVVRTNEPTPSLAKLTVMAWVKLDTAPALAAGRRFWFDADNEWGLSFQGRLDGRVDVQCQVLQSGGRFPWVTATLASATSWNHVACSFDGNRLRLFLNGAKTEVDPSDGDIQSVSDQGVQIGRDGVDQSTGFVDGLIRPRPAHPPQHIEDAAADACP